MLTAFPPGMRMAQPGDQAHLLDLFLHAHAENGWGGVNVAAAEAAIDSAIWHRGDVIAVAPGPTRIEAAIGLRLARLWYGTDADWFWTELLVYVHPDHRRSRHALRLLQFADWWAESSKIPVFINVQPRSDLGRKMRLFSRRGRLVGATFQFGVNTV